MRNADQTCVNGHLMICITEGELQDAIGLLTQLNGRDLVSETKRLAAIDQLSMVLARVRDVTKNQSPVSQGEFTSQ